MGEAASNLSLHWCDCVTPQDPAPAAEQIVLGARAGVGDRRPGARKHSDLRVTQPEVTHPDIHPVGTVHRWAIGHRSQAVLGARRAKDRPVG